MPHTFNPATVSQIAATGRNTCSPLWAIIKPDLVMKKGIYYLLLLLLTIAIPILLFGVYNTMVSLKYETNSPDECVSLVSGQNLCLTNKTLQVLVVSCITALIALLAFRKKVLKL